MTGLRRRALLLAAATPLALPALAQDAPIRLGWLATLDGPFAAGGEDAFRCMQMLLESRNAMAGGRRVEVMREGTNGQPDVAVARARKLFEQDEAEVIIGPLGGAEAIALRDFSRTLSGRTIVNGSAAAPDVTLRNPSPNFFRFNTDAAQWMAGLGTHVRRVMKVPEVAVVAGDYPFQHAQAFGFSLEYCSLGGRATHLWSQLGAASHADAIARIPASAGALVLLLAASDALAFLTQYAQANGALPVVAGTGAADDALLSTRGPHRRLLPGLVSAGPVAEVHDDPAWQDFVARYRRRWSGQGGLATPSLHGVLYHTALQAVLLALDEVRGDLGAAQEAFQRTLAGLRFATATGAEVRLDANRQAISDNLIHRIEERPAGGATVSFARAMEVRQTLGLPEARFLALGAPGRDNPGCVARP
ncbi:ABC transporter substrate-binding protein [Falsiroseomonas oryzae]|uniref:ABC transporter substrate-binding protein n=1 Tax=Falsiroseomonas oryzae TaxID=2766473 RepID=UPI0022EB123F|nr:ABC transporter substrate-binding protein [Roseomonas sp. MO-31]